jgi:pilus assembly protein CpaB
MRTGSAVSLAVALVFGLAAAVLVRGVLQSADARPARSERTIVVAAQPIGFGNELTSDNLRVVPWTGEAALDGAYASVAELNRDGRRLALASLQRNEPVLASKVTAPNQRATLSTQIDEGMRAVSVRVDEVRGVAGFIFPGDRVDVILTRGETGSQDAASAAYADVLLQNAKVLAIDQSAYERPDKPAIARAVTLELNVQQAQAVILGQAIGRLSLVLRQTNETGTGVANRVTAADISMVTPNPTDAKVAELEKKLAEMKKATEQSDMRVGEGTRKLTELEQRIRDELARPTAVALPPPQIAIAPPPLAAPPVIASQGVIVTVTRNASKREQYSVTPER